MLRLYNDCGKKKEVLVETLLAMQPENEQNQEQNNINLNQHDSSMTMAKRMASQLDEDKEFPGEERKSEDGGLNDLCGFVASQEEE